MNKIPATSRHRRALGFGILTLFFIGLAITPAQESKPRPTPANPESAQAREERHEVRERTKRAIATFEKEVFMAEDKAQHMQERIDTMKMELGISDLELAADGLAANTGETLRAMDRAMIETRITTSQLQGLYDHLRKMPRPELRQALPTAAPDHLLSHLMQKLAEVQQEQVMAKSHHGKGHPELIAVASLEEKINAQIDERLDGIMAGLKIRLSASWETMAQMREEIRRERQQLIERAIQIRPIFEAKRELDNLRQVHDQLYMRLQQIKLDMALAQ